jgi:hypothetical protein
MKPAPGKHGSAMATRIAKKIQRQNVRHAGKKLIQEEAASSGLGLLQVEHFRSMDLYELKLALLESRQELSRLEMFPASPAKDKKIDEKEKIVAYIEKLMKAAS